MEIEYYLQELLVHDENTTSHGEDLHNNYFHLVVSKTQGSLLSFHGVKVLPPLLSEADKHAMREYRRKAVNLEQKLFEARRQKYSNLLLQVMQLMDQFQSAERGNQVDNSKPKHPQPQIHQSVRTEGLPMESKMTAATENLENQVDEHTKFSTNNDDNKPQDETKRREYKTLKEEDDYPAPVFLKPKLHNSSSSPRHDKNITINSSSQSGIPSQMSMYESVGNVHGRESVSSSSSTLRAFDQGLLRETIESRQDLNPSDSLASTVLSMAFTVFASQQSKSAQRQLNMDIVNHNLYQSYYHKVKPLTSTPNDLQRPRTVSSQKAATKKSVKTSTVSSTCKVNTKTDTEQDRALEKLEMIRKKLSDEKEKEMFFLRQQELARFRINKEKPGQLVSKEHYKEVNRDVYSQEPFASRPGSDMYSIAERSFEGMSSFKQDDQNESTSDKENNIYDNYDNQTLYRNQAHDYKDDFEERYSSGMESRPISVHSKQSIRKDRRRSSLYVRQEFQKQFKIEMNKESSGRDKFSILSAYAKGFMTRHLLQTEKVQALIKTIKDTSEFLADISREGTTCHQDKSLQQRVQAQLVAAKSKLYDIFFTIPISERMAYVAHSRNAAREREDRINSKSTAPSNQRTRKLSAATMKAMQRRQVETNANSDVKKATAGSQLGKRRSLDARAFKPVQSTKSPQVQVRSQAKRRSLVSPLAKHSIGKKNYNSRPATAIGTRPPSRKSIGRSSTEAVADKPIRQPRTSLDTKLQSTKRIKTNGSMESKSSKLPVKKSGGSTYRVLKEDLDNSRPSTANVVSYQPAPQPVVDNRPKTAIGTRRFTRSMAAKFNKQ